MSLSRSDGKILLIWAALGLIGSFFTYQSQSAQSINFGQLITELSQPKISYKIDLNRATYVELLEIPGIGPTLAKRILQFRIMHGPYLHWQDLDKIKGIGPATIKKIQESNQICMGIECKSGSMETGQDQ